MTAEDVLRLMANITILGIGVTLLGFIIGYGVFFNWRKTPGGRSVMYFVGSLELLILLAAFLNWVHIFQDETEQLLRLEVFVAILVASSRMLYVLVARWHTTGSMSIDVDLKNRKRDDDQDAAERS